MKLFSFPEGFLWGSATSSHQVEGANHLNDWWHWEEKGRLKLPSLNACEHYERYLDDFDLAKSLGHNAHRFSVEWSRLQPQKNKWNQAEFDHYRAVIKALIERGMEPMVTLHHFTIPNWLAEEGGWESPRILHHFEELARRCAENFGDLVTYWVTINEPMVYLFKGYVMGDWPPGIISIRRALRALRYMVHGHIRAYKAIHDYAQAHHGMKKPKVGVAQHLSVFSPCSPGSIFDRLSAFLRSLFSNHLFLRALHHGFLFFPGVYFEPLPMRRTMDYIGVNYYTRHFTKFDGFGFPGVLGIECGLEHHQAAGQKNSMGWETYPKGLFDLLLELKPYYLPIIIMENGMCTENDVERTEFIRRHVAEVAHAIEKKVPVIGYMYWSLLDNFEWDSGFGPRFGIIHVDYKTQKREVKDSARFLAQLARSNSIELIA